jgi:protoheme IX farnesyltransferase
MQNTLQLFRPKVSLMVGLSAFAGACLFDSNLHITHVFAVLSALFLSAGCSALNQYQECEEDAVMSRTSDRPIPSGTVDGKSVLRISAVMLTLSAAFMLLGHNMSALIFIPFTLLVYNLIYTPLKKVTPFALLIGSVTGAIPPVLGYAVTGGEIKTTGILLVAAVLYVWQTPHFALLSEKYKTDYKTAGFKTLSGTYGKTKSDLFIKIWLTGYICALLLIPISDIYKYSSVITAHVLITLAFAAALYLNRQYTARTFHILNISMVIFFLMLVVDRIII